MCWGRSSGLDQVTGSSGKNKRVVDQWQVTKWSRGEVPPASASGPSPLFVPQPQYPDLMSALASQRSPDPLTPNHKDSIVYITLYLHCTYITNMLTWQSCVLNWVPTLLLYIVFLPVCLVLGCVRLAYICSVPLSLLWHIAKMSLGYTVRVFLMSLAWTVCYMLSVWPVLGCTLYIGLYLRSR